MIALLLGVPAHAGPCSEPLSRIQLGVALADLAELVEDGETGEATFRGDDLGRRLLCLSAPADPALLARYAELRGETVADGPPARVEGGWVAPRGGAVYVDGVAAPVPEATAGRHLVQRFDGDGVRVDAAWVDGTTFPDGWVTAGGGTIAAAAPDRTRSRPIGSIVAGAVLLAVSGTTYALAGASAGSMPDLATSEDLTAARSRANAYVVASGASLAGAVGVVILSF